MPEPNLYETWYVYRGTWTHLNGILHKSLPRSICMCIPPSLLGNGSIDTFPWQQIHATIEEFLEASFSIRSVSYQRRVCGCLCIPLPLLGNGSVNTFLRQRRIVGDIFFYAVRVLSKESRRLVLTRTCWFFLPSLRFFFYFMSCHFSKKIGIVETKVIKWNSVR
jgi:hypothetical protein